MKLLACLREQMLWVLASFLTPATFAAQGMTVPDNRPNVVLIVLDDLGIELLPFYGYSPTTFCIAGSPPPSCIPNPPALPFPPTPNLAAFAQQGVRFQSAYSYPVCGATRAALLTGRHAFRTGVGDIDPLPLSEITIAEMLKGGFPPLHFPRQYSCGLFGKNGPVGDPIAQGFDRFVGKLGNGSHWQWQRVDGYAGQTPVGPVLVSEFDASVTRAEAVTWMTTVKEPFFAYVCFNTPHGLFEVPPLDLLSPQSRYEVENVYGKQAGQNLTNTDCDHLAYRWLIEATDTEIGSVVAGLGNRAARTTFFVVGDNGTPPRLLLPPYEGGPASEGGHAKGSVYEQGVRVPMIAWGNRVPGTGVHTEPVSVVDLWATIAEVTGADPGATGIDSVSLRPLLLDPQSSLPRPPVFCQVFSAGFHDLCQVAPPPVNQRALIDMGFKYIRRNCGSPVLPCTTALCPIGGEELYDLVADPTECWNLVSDTNYANLLNNYFRPEMQFSGAW